MLASYLLGGRAAPAEAVERYARACDAVFSFPTPPKGLAVLRFIRRRPWSLPFLDAATAILEPQALLRKKLFLMLSILETMPANADTFTPRAAPRWRVLLRLARLGLTSALKAAAGLAILPVARRSR